MLFQQAKQFIINKLEKELPKHLQYHSMEHVMDVYGSAEHIGKLENITGYEMQLLLTAVLFHDAGFIKSPNMHEEESCRIAAKYLPAYGYSANEINKINGLILATRIPQSPKNHLEEIICDSDLDYLGRDDFFSNGNKLYLEFIDAGIVKDENDWNKLQVRFLESHHYFTGTALKLRKQKKEQHLEMVKAKIDPLL